MKYMERFFKQLRPTRLLNIYSNDHCYFDACTSR